MTFAKTASQMGKGGQSLPLTVVEYAEANLILTPFTGPGRKADPALAPETSDSPIDVRYGLDNAAPMRSYAFNRTHLANEPLDSSTSVFGEADEDFDVANSGGPGSECTVRLGRANATERQAGCHTLEAHPSAECFRLWGPGVDPEFASVVASQS